MEAFNNRSNHLKPFEAASVYYKCMGHKMLRGRLFKT